VVVIDSDDKDTCTGFVFKRKRVGEVVVPSPSASSGLTPAFRDNPLSASSPHHLIIHEGERESALEGQQMPSTPELPMLLQQILKCFQVKEVLESLSGNLFDDHVAHGLGDFLIAFSLALSRAQEAEELKARMAELEEELSLKTKAFANHVLTRATRPSNWKRILPLRNNVVDLEKKVEEMKAKMAMLEERATQCEVLLRKVEGELDERVELFKKTEEELTKDVADTYDEGFQDVIAQFACVHSEVDLSPFS